MPSCSPPCSTESARRLRASPSPPPRTHPLAASAALTLSSQDLTFDVLREEHDVLAFDAPVEYDGDALARHLRREEVLEDVESDKNERRREEDALAGSLIQDDANAMSIEEARADATRATAQRDQVKRLHAANPHIRAALTTHMAKYADEHDADGNTYFVRARVVLLDRFRRILAAREAYEFRPGSGSSESSYEEEDVDDATQLELLCTYTDPLTSAVDLAIGAVYDARFAFLGAMVVLEDAMRALGAAHVGDITDCPRRDAETALPDATCERNTKKWKDQIAQVATQIAAHVERLRVRVAQRDCPKQGKIWLRKKSEYLCSAHYVELRAKNAGCVFGTTTCEGCESVVGKEPGQVFPASVSPLLCSPCYMEYRAKKAGCIFGTTTCEGCESVVGKEPGQVFPASVSPLLCSPCYVEYRAKKAGCVLGTTTCEGCESVFGKEPGQVFPKSVSPLLCSPCYMEQRAKNAGCVL